MAVKWQVIYKNDWKDWLVVGVGLMPVTMVVIFALAMEFWRAQ